MDRRKLIAAAPLAAAALLPAGRAEARKGGTTHQAKMSGGQEVPPADSRASGTTRFSLDPRGHKATVEIVVQNISDVTTAHLHMGAAGVAGPPVVLLYGPIAPAGAERGVLLCRTFTAADLIGPLAGMTMADLMDLIDDDLIYVNVHTTTFPAGELRGQLAAHGRGRGRGGDGGHGGGGGGGEHHH